MSFAMRQQDRDIRSALKLVTPPAAEPVSRTEAKTHCRVDSDITADDTLIDALIVAARQHVEEFTGRALITQTWDFKLETWPGYGEIVLPVAPLVSVTSVSYRLEGGSVSTLSSSAYIVDTDSDPGRLLLAAGESWPSDALDPGPSVAVRFVAGYGADGTAVPQTIRQAMLLLIAHHYENREAVIDTGRRTLLPVPLAVESLLFPYCIWGF